MSGNLDLLNITKSQDYVKCDNDIYSETDLAWGNPSADLNNLEQSR